MRKVTLLLLLVAISSCNLTKEKGITFRILNTSDFPITEVEISTSENLGKISIDRIEKSEDKEGFLSMKDNKMDGSYILKYTINGVTKETSDGYYTNGGGLESYIGYEIQNNTALVRFVELED